MKTHTPSAHGVRLVGRRAVLTGMLSMAAGCASIGDRQQTPVRAIPHDRTAPQVLAPYGFYGWCREEASVGGGRGDLLCPH